MYGVTSLGEDEGRLHFEVLCGMVSSAHWIIKDDLDDVMFVSTVCCGDSAVRNLQCLRQFASRVLSTHSFGVQHCCEYRHEKVDGGAINIKEA